MSARVDGMTAANMAAIQDGLAPEYSEPHFQEKAAELAQLADDLENAMNAPGGEE